VKIIKIVLIVCGASVLLYVLLTFVIVTGSNIQSKHTIKKYSDGIEVAQTLLKRLASDGNIALTDLTFESKSVDSILSNLSALRKAVKTVPVKLGVPTPGKSNYPPFDIILICSFEKFCLKAFERDL